MDENKFAPGPFYEENEPEGGEASENPENPANQETLLNESGENESDTEILTEESSFEEDSHAEEEALFEDIASNLNQPCAAPEDISAEESANFASEDGPAEGKPEGGSQNFDDIFVEEDILNGGAASEPESKAKGRAKIPVIIVCAVIAAVLIAYLVLCGIVKNKDTILNNVSIDGIGVGSLTVSEAAALLEEELSGNTDDASLEVSALGETYSVSLGSVLDTDWEQTALAGYSLGHSSYITCGWYWIASLFSSTEIASAPYAAYEDELAAALDEAGITALSSVVETTWEITGDSLVFTMGTSGQVPDTGALSELIFAAIENSDYDTVIECPLADSSPSDIDIDSIYDEVYTEPENATLDPDNDYAIVESEAGVSFDKDAAEDALSAASDGETVTIELVYTEPDIDTQTLEDNLFSDTLGTYTTTVSGTSDRKTNVKLASAACEVILLPGETFSYNETVGERTTAKGYKAASAYSNGATVQTVGGGVCQVSSTLYVACLYANLEIVERHAHSYASSYMPLGWDATVSWGSLDYQFKNNTNYPIKIEASYSSDNKLTMSVIGTDETGYTVKIVSKTYSTTAYKTETIEDDTLAEGKTVVDQTGYTGYKVQTWRYVYDADGNLLSDDEEAYSVYKSRNKIVRVGTKSSSSDDDESEEDEDEDED